MKERLIRGMLTGEITLKNGRYYIGDGGELGPEGDEQAIEDHLERLGLYGEETVDDEADR